MTRTEIQLVVSETLEMLGMTSGTLTQSKAEKTYGKWFKDAVRAGRLHPVSVGEGRNGWRMYSMRDILSLRAQDLERASLDTRRRMGEN